MNKKLIAIIVVAVVVISTVIVTIFGSRAASGEYNIKVTDIIVYGHFDDNLETRLSPNTPITIIKDAQHFQIRCEIVPGDATDKELVYTSNNSNYIKVDQNGLVTFLDTSKSATITISNRDSGIKVTISFVKANLGGGNIDDPWA